MRSAVELLVSHLIRPEISEREMSSAATLVIIENSGHNRTEKVGSRRPPTPRSESNLAVQTRRFFDS